MFQEVSVVTTQQAPSAGALGADPVSRAQENLNVEGQQQAQFVTRESFDAMQRELSGQVRGLQGTIDRYIAGQEQTRKQSEREAYLASLTPEQRQAAEEYEKRFVPKPEASQQAGDPVVEQWKDVVKRIGVDPNDPRIDYSIAASDQMEFLNKVYEIKHSAAKPAAPAPQQQAQPNAVKPPKVDGAPGGNNGGGYEYWLDQRLTGKIDRATWNQKKREFGRA